MKALSIFLVGSAFVFSACSGQFWGGTGTGVLGAGAGYEYHLDQQMKKVEADYEAGRIDQEEYEIRKDQIRRDSVLK